MFKNVFILFLNTEKENKSMNENILPVTSRKVWEDDAVATTLVAEQT